MKRSYALRALGALALAAALAPLPALAGHNVRMTATMLTGSAQRVWLTVYRSEFSGMQRTIVASGWMDRRNAFATEQYNGYNYFFRAQVDAANNHIIADTTVEINPNHNQRLDLVGSIADGFHWQIPR